MQVVELAGVMGNCPCRFLAVKVKIPHHPCKFISSPTRQSQNNHVIPLPCRSPMPDTIGRSYTDTDTGNDVTHSVGHTYVTYVAHTIHMFQNIMSLCFETYTR